MSIVCSIMAFIYLLIGYKKYKNIYNPLVVFSIIWIIIPIGASLRLFNINSASIETYSVIAIGILGFGVGVLIISNFHKNYYLKSEIASYKLNMRIFKPLAIISLIILIIGAFQPIKLLLQGYTISDIYTMTIQYNLGADNILKKSASITILTTFIARPMMFLIIPVSIINYFENNKKDIMVIAFIMVLLDLITKGGRMTLIYIAIYYIICIKIYGKKIELSFRTKRNIKFGIVFLIIIILSITIQRGASVLQQLYIYPFGSIPHLDYRLNELGKFQDYTYGFSSLQGILRPFINFIQGLDILPSIVNLFSKAELYTYVENGVLISDSIRYNAFTTLFYYFYVDGGYLGVLIGSLVFGVICQKSYDVVKKNLNIKSATMYLLIFTQGIFNSYIRFAFAGTSFGLAMIYSLIIFKKYKNKNYNIKK